MNEQEQKTGNQSRKRGNPGMGMNPLDIGKIPPQATELESAVIGAMMLEKEAVNSVIEILKPDSFYKDVHQKIYFAIQDLFARSEPIDILTVTQTLKKQGDLEFVGGAYYISQLTDRVASTANVETHARIIAQKFIQRELIRISNEIIKDAFEESTDVFELLDKAEDSLFKVAEGNIKKSYSKMSGVMKEALDGIEAAMKNKDGVSGVPTGFTKLDRITGGWQRSDMIVLAARPGMGKTAFVLSMARNMAVDYQVPVAVFSLEMSAVQLVNRLISGEAEIEGDKLRRGSLDDHEYHKMHDRITRLAEAPLFIDDTPGLSVFDLRAKCRRLKAQHGIDMIVIDYLQLMTAGGNNNKGNREQEISTISRSIKGLAKELDVPIIALSQLSRAVESRGGDKKPMLSDLRESGAIEQDADIVSFIYRPEYYGIDVDEEGNSLKGVGEIIIAKHRNGSLDTVQLRFKGQYAKFVNMDAFDTDDTFSSLGPNVGFAQNTLIVGSKMNDMPANDEPRIGEVSSDDPPF